MIFSLRQLALTALLPFVLAVDAPVNPSLIGQIRLATTHVERINLVKDDFVFDFKKHKFYSYSPGGVVNANAATFPAAEGEGLTMAWLALGPCAMLPAHYHPRATNFVVAIEGDTTTWMVPENGGPVIKTDLSPGKMTIFPKGSLHTMQNFSELHLFYSSNGLFHPPSRPFHPSENGGDIEDPEPVPLTEVTSFLTGCNNSTLISALNSEDAGTHNILNGLYSFPADMVGAAFGGEAPKGDGIPPVGSGAALGSAECRKKCKL